MLSATQIQTARSSLGIQPTATPQVDRVSELQKAWESSPSESSSGASYNPPASFATSEGQSLSTRGKQIMKDITTVPEKAAAAGSSPLADVAAVGQAGGHVAGQIAGAATDILGNALFSFVPQQVKDQYGSAINWLADRVNSVPGMTDKLNQVNDFMDKNPDITRSLGDVINTLLLNEANKTSPTVSDTAGKIKDTIGSVQDSLSNLLESKDAAQAATQTVKEGNGLSLADRLRANAGKGNVDPRIQASAERLPDPAQTYTSFLDQAKAATQDVKADPPISTVGEKIGKAYDTVVQMRRDTGQQMADALKNVSDTPTDVSATVAKFEQDIQEKFGVKYDVGQQGMVQTGKQSSLTSSDRELLGKYITDLKVLGDNPTIGELDAFMKRIPQELDVAKAAKNITDTTPAEAFIKQHINALKDAFNPDTTGNEALKPYYDARRAYANLSNFLDEGSKYLGAKTQAGDYSRDVSVAKSSAESILSGGKKDWLLRLEGLTGYPALDESALAIQAMKDAGDNRGLSLFKTLSSADITPSRLVGKLIGMGTKKIGGAVVGSPADQTSAFLKSLPRKNI